MACISKFKVVPSTLVHGCCADLMDPRRNLPPYAARNLPPTPNEAQRQCYRKSCESVPPRQRSPLKIEQQLGCILRLSKVLR